MKIISFTMVNNESEIIESFIRYNYNFIDEMVIIDNGCTDNTILILRNLINEGYSITIYDESIESFNQYRLENKYLSKIIDEKGPDIIIPLDADEFLIGDGNPRELLEKLSLDRIYYINWQWYVMTEEDDTKESFIPLRLKYHLKKTVWNYSDKSPVTKTIIPCDYYKRMKLTLSMGHHTVYGNSNAKIQEIRTLKLAHYRAFSEEQLIYKTSCYTMRDIVTMGNNSETAQRTNQMALIESGIRLREAAVESSYAGYPKDIIFDPIDLSYCSKDTAVMRYNNLARESVALRVMKTGQEIAVRAYNLERQKKEKRGLAPIVLWLDGIKKTDVFMPDPTNSSTMLVAKYNVRAYLTFQSEIKYLKANYRLIVTPGQVKFIPHKYIVVPDTCNMDEIKNTLLREGYQIENVISLSDYKSRLGILKSVYSNIMMIPGMMDRVCKYIGRNGVSNTLKKIRERLGRR